jgi:hypothetical protein
MEEEKLKAFVTGFVQLISSVITNPIYNPLGVRTMFFN